MCQCYRWHIKVETQVWHVYKVPYLPKIELNRSSKSRRILKCIYFFIPIENGIHLSLDPIDKNEIIHIKWVTRDELQDMCCNKQLRYFTRKWNHITNYMIRNQEQLKVKWSI